MNPETLVKFRNEIVNILKIYTNGWRLEQVKAQNPSDLQEAMLKRVCDDVHVDNPHFEQILDQLPEGQCTEIGEILTEEVAKLIEDEA